MAEPGSRLKLDFSLHELAGSVGDFGTILPLVLAVSAVAGLSIGYILLFFGIWFIVTGLYYRLPVPVEPMKVIAVVAISENMSAGQIAVAGIILGILFLSLGFWKWLDLLEEYIPRSVIRGIQLGLTLLLLRTSAGLLSGDVMVFLGALALMTVLYGLSRFTRLPDLSAIVVIVVAFAAGIAVKGFPGLAPLPMPQIVVPSPSDIPSALWSMVVPQALLTITNAILATSLLASDLFKKEVRPARLSRTIGLMNLTSVPFGGFPMSHGAGGLAGQYRFGARTGGSNVYAGIILLLLAFFFASPAMLGLVSGGFFAALLVFAAIEMAKYGLKTDSYLVTGTMAILSFAVNMTIAFVAGICVAYALQAIKRRRGRGRTLT